MAQPVEPGYIRSPRVTFTRPANTTAYSIGDALASTATAGDVTPLEFEVARENGGCGKIIGSSMLTDSATAFAAMRLHLFNRPPFATGLYQADNAALALTYAALRVGGIDAPSGGPLVRNALPIIDFQTFVAQSACAEAIGLCDQTELDFMCLPDRKVIYGLLEVRAAFTPASGQSFTVSVSSRGLT